MNVTKKAANITFKTFLKHIATSSEFTLIFVDVFYIRANHVFFIDLGKFLLHTKYLKIDKFKHETNKDIK